MPSSLLQELGASRERVAGLDPSTYSPDDAAAVVTALASLGKACSAARARFAARAAAGGVHRKKGYADADDWLASESGTSTVEARRELETTKKVAQCPATADALANGELTLTQAGEIANTEEACPGSEGEMLELAHNKPLRRLKEEARKRRLEAMNAEDLARRQRRARSFRRWPDEDGMICGSFRLPPAEGLAVLSRIDAEADRIRREAKARGEEEPWEAHAADAFVKIVMGGSRPSDRKSDVVFVCDMRAYRRGHAENGEVCHVIGGGPVPVSDVRDEMDTNDPFIKVVLHDGVRVHLIKHFGRYLKAEVRTALDLGPPPSFEGRQCGCGCGKLYKLQNDHVDPLANGGPTSLDNLQPRTPSEHAAKTAADRQAGRLGQRRRQAAGARPSRGSRGARTGTATPSEVGEKPSP